MPETPLMDQSKHSPLVRLSRSVLKKVNQALKEYSLIKDGDRVCVAVSGGKDSLSLLHLLHEHKRFFTVKYELGAVHVVSDFADNAEKTRDYLQGVFEVYNIPYAFEHVTVTKDRQGNYCEPSCFWCSWNRRNAIFRHCVDKGYNKLALGHHFDDIAETILMNLVFHGTLESILPGRTFFDGAFDVIRPLFYLKERELVRFAKMAGFLSGTCTCTHADNGKRKYMKKLVADLSHNSKSVHKNLWNAAQKWHEAFGEHPLHKDKKLSGEDIGESGF